VSLPCTGIREELSVEVTLKYGHGTQTATIPDANYIGELNVSTDLPGAEDPYHEVLRSLRDPIGTSPLAEMVRGVQTVAIVVNDHTRRTPTRHILPPVLDELNAAGVPDDAVTIIFGCGTHRDVTPEEARYLLGDQCYGRVRYENNDHLADDLVNLGDNGLGNTVWVNHTFATADFRILIGDIEFHYYAGYTGGRKSVLPAVAGDRTIQHNHAQLLHPNATTGNLVDNPIHEDMLASARLARADFIVNSVNNTKMEMVRSFAGDVDRAHLEGVKMVDAMYKVTLPRLADIVVVSSGGAPKDLDLYQGSKALDNGLRAVRKGGALVGLVEAPEGLGHRVFDTWIREYATVEELEHQVKHAFKLGGHKAYYLRKYNAHAKVYLVTSLDRHMVENVLNLTKPADLQEAVDMAFDHVGKDAKVLVIPAGDKILPCLSEGACSTAIDDRPRP
jgi:nickel-dependent lactate racemase